MEWKNDHDKRTGYPQGEWSLRILLRFFELKSAGTDDHVGVDQWSFSAFS